MFLWPYFEFALMVLALTFALTQMIIPVLMNKPAFPFFRKLGKKKKELQEKEREVLQEREIIRLEKKINKLKLECIESENKEEGDDDD